MQSNLARARQFNRNIMHIVNVFLHVYTHKTSMACSDVFDDMDGEDANFEEIDEERMGVSMIYTDSRLLMLSKAEKKCLPLQLCDCDVDDLISEVNYTMQSELHMKLFAEHEHLWGWLSVE